MEHLVFQPDVEDPSETVSACRATVLETDWSRYDSLLDFVPPETPWLGFTHNQIPLQTSLQEYPVASGWNAARLWNGDLRHGHHSLGGLDNRHIGQLAASFLQSWLYYGLLETIVGKKIHVSYLMRQNPRGEEMLYTRNLHFCLQARVFAIRQAANEMKREINKAIQFTLSLAHDWVLRFATWSVETFRQEMHTSYPGFMDLISKITPAIARLGEAIGQMRLYALQDHPTISTLDWHIPDDVALTRRRRMKSLGWCEFQLRLLEDTTNQSTIDWVDATKMRQDQAGHETCTRAECARNHVDESTYQQLHHDTGCQCKPLRPDLEMVMNILRDDQIPLMCLENLDGEPKLSVGAAPKGCPGDYVAFSHVWVDGIGGSTETGLLTCQVFRLSALSSAVRKDPSTPAKFWVDSMGIPRSDKAVHHQALVGIRDVYICASAVVVIDKTIQRCSLTASTEELYAHIYMSAWMQRMWTYEEAVLAKRLIFVLKNDHLHVFQTSTPPVMRRTVSIVWQTLAAQLFRLRADQEVLNIGHVYQAFRWRSTNAKQDEFLSISSMLGLNTASLIDVQGDERTMRFWLMLGKVPFNAPLLDGPKLTSEGFRWAPKTMMFPSKISLDSEVEGEKCDCTAEGLVGTYLTVPLDLILKGSAASHGSIFYIWVNGHEDNLRSETDHRALLRVYCVESWPPPPEGATFNALMLGNETKTIPDPGQWFPGVALLNHDALEQGPKNQASKSFGANRVYKYVGRVLVERLRNEELSSRTRTVMFEGSEVTQVDAQGTWSVSQICIT